MCRHTPNPPLTPTSLFPPIPVARTGLRIPHPSGRPVLPLDRAFKHDNVNWSTSVRAQPSVTGYPPPVTYLSITTELLVTDRQTYNLSYSLSIYPTPYTRACPRCPPLSPSSFSLSPLTNHPPQPPLQHLFVMGKRPVIPPPHTNNSPATTTALFRIVSQLPRKPMQLKRTWMAQTIAPVSMSIVHVDAKCD